MRRVQHTVFSISLFVNLALLLFCCSSEEPHALYLTWKKDPTTTMTIQWISSKSSETDVVEYRKVESEKKETSWGKSEGIHFPLPQEVPYVMHIVELQSLEPNSSYQFRLKMSDHEYLFRTMPTDLKDGKSVTFLAGGDTNHRGVALFEDTNRAACKHEPFFVVFGGDLAYACPKNKNQEEDSKLWLEWIASYSKTMITPSGHLIPLLVTLGNHDVKGHYKGDPQDAPFFYSLFAMPGLPGYNVLRCSDYLSFYFLDSNHTNRIKGTQTKWLAYELAKDTNIMHRFAVYHVPAFPSVRQYKMYESASIRKHWVPLFEKYGLHVAFENNDHAYKRTYPMLQEKVHPSGVVYIGDGSWGTKPRIPKKAKETNYLAKTKSARQFVKVTLTEDSREFWAITPDGEIIDHYIQFSLNTREKMLAHVPR